MALSLPIYLRGRTYVLHVRVRGRQIKRSLRTADPQLAKLRALALLEAAYMAGKGSNPKISDFSFDPERLRRYELDLQRGIARASDAEDHARMMEAIECIGPIAGGWPKTVPEATAAPRADDRRKTLTLSGLMEIFFSLKSSLSAGTGTDYRATVKEFEGFANSPALAAIDETMVTDYMRWLTARGNKEPTIDKKIGTLRALFNFAKKQKLYVGENPAADRNLLTREQKNARGSKFLELDEVKQVLNCPEFRQFETAAPNFYLITLAGLVTGIRVSALAALTVGDFRVSVGGNHYLKIVKDKTPSGHRSVPIPQALFDRMKDYLTANQSFGFASRSNGKGASDPVRKMLDEHLKAIGLNGSKLTFHSFRKTLNNYLLHNKVEFEKRCQFIGHKLDHVNVAVYGEKFSVDEIAEVVSASQRSLLELVGFV